MVFILSDNLLSAAGWVGSIVAPNDTRESTRLASTVGPSSCSRSSYLEASDVTFAKESWSRRRSNEACESDEQGIAKKHRECGVPTVRIEC